MSGNRSRGPSLDALHLPGHDRLIPITRLSRLPHAPAARCLFSFDHSLAATMAAMVCSIGVGLHRLRPGACGGWHAAPHACTGYARAARYPAPVACLVGQCVVPQRRPMPHGRRGRQAVRRRGFLSAMVKHASEQRAGRGTGRALPRRTDRRQCRCRRFIHLHAAARSRCPLPAGAGPASRWTMRAAPSRSRWRRSALILPTTASEPSERRHLALASTRTTAKANA